MNASLNKSHAWSNLVALLILKKYPLLIKNEVLLMTSMTKVAIMLAVKQDLSIQRRTHYTINELTHSVQVSRSTLYYHFHGGLPETFNFTFQQEILVPIQVHQLDWPATVRFLLRYIAQHQMLVKNMYALSDWHEFMAIQPALAQTLLNNYDQFGKTTNSVVLLAQLQMLCSALLFELQLWLLDNFDEDWHLIQQRVAVFDQNLANPATLSKNCTLSAK